MKKSAELAIEVLLEDGLIEPDGSWWKFRGELPVEARALVQSMEAAIVSVGLPWLRIREIKDGAYVPKTSENRLMCAYKLAKGIAWNDRAWDKFNYERNARACKKLLAAFDRNDQDAAYWLLEFAAKFKESGLSWNLDTAAAHAWDSKGEREAR